MQKHLPRLGRARQYPKQAINDLGKIESINHTTFRRPITFNTEEFPWELTQIILKDNSSKAFINIVTFLYFVIVYCTRLDHGS